MYVEGYRVWDVAHLPAVGIYRRAWFDGKRWEGEGQAHLVGYCIWDEDEAILTAAGLYGAVEALAMHIGGGQCRCDSVLR